MTRHMGIVKVVITTEETADGEFTVRTTVYVSWWLLGPLGGLLAIALWGICR